MPWVEGVGYVASVLVAISLMMSNIWRLRWVNLAGALTFSIYGWLVGAWPVCIVNAFIVMIDTHYIVQMCRQHDFLSHLDVTQGDHRFLRRFLDFHRTDILRFFPDFRWDVLEPSHPHCIFILRNMLPVGLVVCRPHENGQVEIVLDYVIPDYRDFANAGYVFSVVGALRQQGYRQCIAHSNIKVHQNYLRRVGFQSSPDDPNCFTREL